MVFIERLVEQPLWNYDTNLLVASVNEAYQLWRTNPRFDSICKVFGSPEKIKEPEDFTKIRPYPQKVYKDNPENMIIGDTGDIRYILSSATTTGISSRVPRNTVSQERLKKVYFQASEDLGADYTALLAPDPTKPGVPQTAVYLYADWGMGNTPHDHLLSFDPETRKPIMDPAKVVAKLNEHSGRKMMMSVPFLILGVYNFMQKSGVKVDMGDGLVFTVGGWKGYDKPIPTPQFSGLVKKEFNASHIDGYSAAEIISPAWSRSKCNPEKKHITSKVFVYTANIEKYMNEGVIEPTKPYESGLAVFVDPLNTTTPGVTLMDDIIKVHPDNYCKPCEIKGPVLEFVNRVKDADQRTSEGCGRRMAKDTEIIGMDPSEIEKLVSKL